MQIHINKISILLVLLLPACSQTSNDAVQPETALNVIQGNAVKFNEPFVFTIEVLGDNINYPIKINTSESANVSYSVDCDNDNIYELYNQTTDAVCHFDTKGNKTIKIIGDLPGILLSDSNDYQVMTIDQWGKIFWKTMEKFSTDCTKLTIAASDAPDLSKVKSLKAMFHGAKAMNSPINHWNVSSIEDMSEMFYEATIFNQPLNWWDTSHVKTMDSMFNKAGSFNQDISSWDVSSVTIMTSMFKEAVSFNQPLNSWNVSHVKAMDMMFSGASAFNMPLDQWNVENVENIEYLFFFATSFLQSLHTWKLKKVKSVYGMFSGDNEFYKNNQDLITTWAEKYHIDVTNIFEKE